MGDFSITVTMSLNQGSIQHHFWSSSLSQNHNFVNEILASCLLSHLLLTKFSQSYMLYFFFIPLPFILTIAIWLLTVYFVHSHWTLLCPPFHCNHVLSLAQMTHVPLQLLSVLAGSSLYAISMKPSEIILLRITSLLSFFIIPNVPWVCYYKDHIYLFLHGVSPFRLKSFVVFSP